MTRKMHDLGGAQGYGPVKVERDYVPFHADWEGVSHAIMMECGYDAPIDWTRHVRELSVPADYFDAPYYLSWAMTYAVLLIQSGRLSVAELTSGQTDSTAATPPIRSTAQALELQRLGAEQFNRATATPAQFGVGDSVATITTETPGHTRLPSYARGATGTVTAHHGAHVLPDDMSKGIETAAHLYTVSFDAQALFGPDAEAGHSMMLDLWEPYLQAAQHK